MRPYVLAVKPEHQQTVKEGAEALRAAVKAVDDAVDAEDAPKEEKARAAVWEAHEAVWKYIHLRYPETRGMACGLGVAEGGSEVFILVEGRLLSEAARSVMAGEKQPMTSELGHSLIRAARKGGSDA